MLAEGGGERVGVGTVLIRAMPGGAPTRTKPSASGLEKSTFFFGPAFFLVVPPCGFLALFLGNLASISA